MPDGSDIIELDLWLDGTYGTPDDAEAWVELPPLALSLDAPPSSAAIPEHPESVRDLRRACVRTRAELAAADATIALQRQEIDELRATVEALRRGPRTSRPPSKLARALVARRDSAALAHCR